MKPWQKEANDSQWTSNRQPMSQIISYYLPIIGKHAYIWKKALFQTSFQSITAMVTEYFIRLLFYITKTFTWSYSNML